MLSSRKLSLAALLAAAAPSGSAAMAAMPWRRTLSAHLDGRLPNRWAIGFRTRHAAVPFLRMPWVWYPEDLWYHGTRAAFDTFKVEGVKRAGGGIGALLGVHFSSKRATAEGFAMGELYRKKGDTRPGRVVAARLRVRRPLDVDMETRLYDDMARRLWAAGALDAYLVRGVDRDALEGRRQGYGFGHDVVEAMRAQKGNYARRYVKLLREAGYDGVLYRNGYESEGFGSPTAIVQPDRIEVVDDAEHLPHVVWVVNAVAHGLHVPARVHREYPGLDRLSAAEAAERVAEWAERFGRPVPTSPRASA